MVDLNTVYQQIGENDRHFNQMVAGGRALASTWLLAAFAGMGFALTNDLEFGTTLSTELLIVLIAAMASVGIFLVWIVDLRVFQRLLHANFRVGLQMEIDNAELPPVRCAMVRDIQSGRAAPWLAVFYALPMSLMVAIGVVFSVLNAIDGRDAAAIGVPFALLLPLAAIATVVRGAMRDAVLEAPAYPAVVRAADRYFGTTVGSDKEEGDKDKADEAGVG